MSKADQAVLERRLRPIYDSLDSNNAKKALQECDKVLKKHPTTNSAKALKALCLIRTERLPEAMELLDTLDVPGARHDESTLQAFIHCYKEAVVPQRINRLYERICEVEPSEHNLTQLFMSYARTKEYQKQNKTGTLLFKTYPNPPYFFWTVMTVVMQALENPALGEKMFLPLAEKMFNAQVKKTGYSEGSGAEVELQLVILEGLSKWEVALEVLESPAAQFLKMAPIFVNERKAGYLEKLGRFEELRDISETELNALPDNWTMWKYRFVAALGTIKSEPTKTEETFQDLLKFVIGHIKKGQYKCRGPSMAELQILKDFKGIEGVDLSAVGRPEDLIFEFVEHFYTKPSCFVDIEIYFCLLDDEAKTSLISKLTDWIEKISKKDEVEGKETKVWAIIVYERVRRVFGDWEKMDGPAKRQKFQQFIAQIVQPGRGEAAQGFLCQLAVSSLWDAWRKEDDQDKFYEMVLLMEYVAGVNSSDPVSKLALIRAYSHIGNTARVTALVKLLDIKSVQNDTLGYLTFSIFELAGRFNLTIINNTQLGLVYDQAEKEIMECLLNAYRNGKFGQIPRLVALSEQMRKSSQALACDVLNRYLSSLFVIDDLDEIITTCYGDEEPINWNEVIDNRDLNVVQMTENESYKEMVADMKNRTYKEFLDITKLRHSVCRALGTVGRITRNGVDAQRARKEMNEEIAAFSNALNRCTTEYQTFNCASRLAQSPCPLHVSQWIHSGGLQIVLRLLEGAKRIVQVLDEGKEIDEDIIGTRKQLADELAKIVDIYNPERKPTRKFWIAEPILMSSRALQTLSTIQVTIRIIDRLVSRNASNTDLPKSSGKNKKKQAKEGESNFTKFCNSLLWEVKDAAKVLHDRLDELIREAGSEDLLPKTVAEDLGQTRMVLETYRPVVDSRVRRSYVTAIEDMQTTIVSRL